MKNKNNYLYTYGTPNRSIQLYNFRDKERAVRRYGEYMLNRTQQIFKWKNLPDSIPQRNLELLLQTCGHCVIIKDNNSNQYAVVGGFGGEPNVYYEPTKYIVANPALPNIKQEWTIANNTIDPTSDDCILIKNDSLLIGLNPLLSRYCTLLVENDISFRLANINTRVSSLISAQDDRTLKSARKFLADIENGEQGIISSSAFFEGLQVENNTRGYSNVLKDLIEYHQYIRASMYNEIGLDANYNMKRTTVLSSEVEADEDALYPLVDDMLYQRKEAVKLWNELYDMDIDVEFASAWQSNDGALENAIKKEELEIEQLEAEIRNTEADTLNILSSITQIHYSEHPENNTEEINDETNTDDTTTINSISNNDDTIEEQQTSNENEQSEEVTEPIMEGTDDIGTEDINEDTPEIEINVVINNNNTPTEGGEEENELDMDETRPERDAA